MSLFLLNSCDKWYFSFRRFIIYFITRAKVRFLLSLKLILLYLCLCVNNRFHDKDWRHFLISFFLSILINQQEVVGSFSSLLNKPWCSSHWMMCSYIFRPSEVKDVTIYDNDSEKWRTVTSSFTLLVHRQTKFITAGQTTESHLIHVNIWSPSQYCC